MSSPQPTAIFEENEKVLAHHQGLIYEAKVCDKNFQILTRKK